MEAVITFSEVSVVIGSVTLLDRLNLTLGPGQPTVVIGPNGSGKTTLLRAAMGLVTPDRGSISGVAQRRAIMFQHPVMLRRSVTANLDYALKAAGVSRAGREARGSVPHL